MRREFATLLHFHRMKQRLGVPIEERRELGALIRQYRQSVLVWCSTSLHAVSPLTFSNQMAADRNPFHAAGHGSTGPSPAGELVRVLDYIKAHTDSSPATLEQLTTPSSQPMVEHWRNAARAAALAEHDLTPDVVDTLTTGQAQVVVGDVAAITQALVILDRRYSTIPGWKHLDSTPRLGWTALAAALDINLGQPDYTVDHRGWRPPAKLMNGSVKPGVLGVLQAQHNLVIHLKAFPSATNLRYVLDSQRLVSGYLAALAERTDTQASARWAGRAETYRRLQVEFRNIAGQIGTGGSAAAEGALAVARVRAVPLNTVIEPRTLAGIQTLFDRLDNRAADIINTGIKQQAYLQRVPLPRLVEGDGNLVAQVRERFTSIDADKSQAALLATKLRPRPAAFEATPGASRASLHGALIQHPRSRADPIAL